MKSWQVATLAFFLLVIMESDAEAYLDPGTGSFVFQTVIATVAGSLFVVKTYWRRIKALFSRPSAHVGKGSDRFAVHVHGQEPAYHDSRFTSLMGVTYIADPTPGRHTAGSLVLLSMTMTSRFG